MNSYPRRSHGFHQSTCQVSGFAAALNNLDAHHLPSSPPERARILRPVQLPFILAVAGSFGASTSVNTALRCKATSGDTRRASLTKDHRRVHDADGLALRCA